MYKIDKECRQKLEIERQNEIESQINNQLEDYNNNYYHNNKNNQLQHLQQTELINDIYKMHLIPPNCPMTPTTYTDFFNDNSKLHNVAPYKLLYEKHPKDGKINTKIEYRNFYSDFKTDSLNYNRSNNKYLNDSENNSTNNSLDSNINVKTLYNFKPNTESNIHNLSKSIDVKLFEETKNKKSFAIPMKSNGSNKLEHLYNDCLNKPTFEYKRFSNNVFQSSQTDKPSQWVENQLYKTNVIEESSLLYIDYMESRNKNASTIYDTVFEDMYIMCYNPPD